MKKCFLFCMMLILLLPAGAGAQDAGYTERAKKYIDQYSTLAILEQKKSGIPASITLGQGILETEAGASELMTEANNHFGIKCKNGWLGPTYTHTDDAPDECFKKYTCAAESYEDHSALLKRNPRYAPLFSLPETDYVAWAKCLKKCGYATNPQYAQKLIKIIEDFKLQDYTYSAFDSSIINSHSAVPVAISVPAADSVNDQSIASGSRTSVKKAPDTNPPGNTIAHPPAQHVATTPISAVLSKPAITHPANIVAELPAKTPVQPEKTEESKIVIVNGLKAIYCYKDEMLLQYAMKYHIGYQQLLGMNDLTDGPLPDNMYVYLERKLTKGTNAQHLVRDGETLLMAAQSEGIQLRSLRELNLLNPGEEPGSGAVLELQRMTHQKPAVRVNQINAHTRDAIVMGDEQPGTQNADYITVNKVKTITYADTAKPHVATKNHIAVSYSSAPAETASVKAEEKTTAIAGKYYTVKPGDSAYSIAKNNSITLDQLMKWNHIDDPRLKIGQTLQVKE